MKTAIVIVYLLAMLPACTPSEKSAILAQGDAFRHGRCFARLEDSRVLIETGPQGKDFPVQQGVAVIGDIGLGEYILVFNQGEVKVAFLEPCTKPA